MYCSIASPPNSSQNVYTQLLSELDLLDISFDEALWNWSVERVTVFTGGEMRFRFKNGVEING